MVKKATKNIYFSEHGLNCSVKSRRSSSDSYDLQEKKQKQDRDYKEPKEEAKMLKPPLMVKRLMLNTLDLYQSSDSWMFLVARFSYCSLTSLRAAVRSGLAMSISTCTCWPWICACSSASSYRERDVVRSE